MEIVYKSFDNKYFKSESKCLKHEKYVLEVQRIFNNLVDINFFTTTNIKPIPYYGKISFGNPSKSNLNLNILGYSITNGYEMGDSFIRFKLRNNKLFVLLYDMEIDETKFLKTIYLDKIFVGEYRNKKIKNICKQ